MGERTFDLAFLQVEIAHEIVRPSRSGIDVEGVLPRQTRIGVLARCEKEQAKVVPDIDRQWINHGCLASHLNRFRLMSTEEQITGVEEQQLGIIGIYRQGSFEICRRTLPIPCTTIAKESTTAVA